MKSVLKIPFQIISKIAKYRRDNFLKNVHGVVHVGANTGQERNTYKSYNLNVVWIEPIPNVFKELEKNISDYQMQKAFQELVTDVEGGEYDFNIANNGGASSSILNFKEHKDLWPTVGYVSTIKIKSTTLERFFEKNRIDPAGYQALVMDTQGSELLVLKGAISLLPSFKYIKTEVPDFESYENCCQLSDMNQFMKNHGFMEYSKHKFASRKGGGNYYDVIYKNMTIKNQ